MRKKVSREGPSMKKIAACMKKDSMWFYVGGVATVLILIL
jgi:hypothetical protein